jgi:hypothetical protein
MRSERLDKKLSVSSMLNLSKPGPDRYITSGGRIVLVLATGQDVKS